MKRPSITSFIIAAIVGTTPLVALAQQSLLPPIPVPPPWWPATQGPPVRAGDRVQTGLPLESAGHGVRGYSLLYATSVACPGDQMNRNINPTMTVSWGNDPPVTPSTPAQPTFAFNTSDFWAQSLLIGFAYRF